MALLSSHKVRDLSFLSVVVPCFNEEAVLRETHSRLVAALEKIPESDFEIIYVDDGSRDDTSEILLEFHRSDPRVKTITLSRNFGQQIAFASGMEHTSGNAVVLMDADLQEPPELIPEMVARWRQGADIAYGARLERKGETAFKLFSARVFTKLMNCSSDVSIPLDAGDFQLMDRKVVNALSEMRERDRFTRGLSGWVGFRREPVYYRREPRFAGEGKQSFGKLLRIARDAIYSFSFVLTRGMFYTGLVILGFSLLGIFYALIFRLIYDVWMDGWALLAIIISFLSGVQMVAFSVVGEYLRRIYGEVKRRPLYLIKQRSGFTE